MQAEPNHNHIEDAKETLEILYETSELLNCNLDKHTISIIVSLIENGANPIAVASILKELKNEMNNNS